MPEKLGEARVNLTLQLLRLTEDHRANSHGPLEKTVPELVAVSQVEAELDGIDRHVGEPGALQQ